MIGQRNLLGRLERLVEQDQFPRFTIIVGERGSGKKTVSSYVAGLLKANYVYLEDNSVASIRMIIEEAYRLSDATVFRIADADSMSSEAKNALLKVTEEAPNKAYFIMTLEDENSMLETIRSRATVFHMDEYSREELREYLNQKYTSSYNSFVGTVEKICDTFGDVDKVVQYDSFFDFVRKVIDSLDEVAFVNLLKISTFIALKDEEDKFDLKLFWKAFMVVCWEHEDARRCAITAKYLQRLKIKSINRGMLFDGWLMEVSDGSISTEKSDKSR